MLEERAKSVIHNQWIKDKDNRYATFPTKGLVSSNLSDVKYVHRIYLQIWK